MGGSCLANCWKTWAAEEPEWPQHGLASLSRCTAKAHCELAARSSKSEPLPWLSGIGTSCFCTKFILRKLPRPRPTLPSIQRSRVFLGCKPQLQPAVQACAGCQHRLLARKCGSVNAVICQRGWFAAPKSGDGSKPVAVTFANRCRVLVSFAARLRKHVVPSRGKPHTAAAPGEAPTTNSCFHAIVSQPAQETYDCCAGDCGRKKLTACMFRVPATFTSTARQLEFLEAHKMQTTRRKVPLCISVSPSEPRGRGRPPGGTLKRTICETEAMHCLAV